MTPSATPHDADADASILMTTDRLRSAALLIGAGLIGFGLILYIAANWDDLGRFGRFRLVGGVIAVGVLVALARSALQAPGLLLAFAATGGMLALIGQTYQTGADAWSLFALWAALTLPWALAARSDALWTGWVTVALTAIVLWQQTQAPFWFAIGDTERIASALGWLGVPLRTWAMALALAALMSPWTPLEHVLGPRRWAFRVALLLVLALIATDTLSAVIAYPRPRLVGYLVGLACLAGMALALTGQRAHDMLLLAACAFAIDSALISGFWRLIIPSGRSEPLLGLVVIGVLAAGIVAGSVLLLMRIARGDQPGPVSAAPEAEPPASLGAPRPWPVVVLSGFGALMAAIPFIAALGVMLGVFLERGAGTYVVALLVLPVSGYIMRQARSLFVEQLAAIGIAVGALVLVWGIYRDLPHTAAGLLIGALALAAAIGIGRPWLAALLGAAATPAIGLALLHELGERATHSPALTSAVWTSIAVAGVAAALAMRQDGWTPRDAGSAHATLSGWLAAALAGLAVSAGQTFLLGAHMGGGPGIGALESTDVLGPARALSAVLAAASAAWLYRELPTLRSPLAVVLMLATAALSAVMPALGAAMMVGALAIGLGWRALGAAAAVAALWIVGAFYYSLALPLTQKAAILAGVGGIIGAAALASGARLPAGLVAAASGTGMPVAPAIGHGLVVLGLLAVCGLSVQAITSREALIRNGQPVFIELAPVDPRSLMQGDYMALRFRVPDEALRHQPMVGARPLGIGKRGADGVLRLTQIGDTRSALAADEMAIELVRKQGRWVVVTDAWYFKEGTGKIWEAARFGEFRVLPNGQALLVGLADKDRVAIKEAR